MTESQSNRIKQLADKRRALLKMVEGHNIFMPDGIAIVNSQEYLAISNGMPQEYMNIVNELGLFYEFGSSPELERLIETAMVS